MNITIPTRQQILKDFMKWTKDGGDSQFQFRRAVRRWKACEYSLTEIPFLFKVTMQQVMDAAALQDEFQVSA